MTIVLAIDVYDCKNLNIRSELRLWLFNNCVKSRKVSYIKTIKTLPFIYSRLIQNDIQSGLHDILLYFHNAYSLFVQVLEDPLPEGIKSTLIIRESRLEHFGVYNCTVSNQYGSDMVEIVLKAQSKLIISQFL